MKLLKMIAALLVVIVCSAIGGVVGELFGQGCSATLGGEPGVPNPAQPIFDWMVETGRPLHSVAGVIGGMIAGCALAARMK